MTIAGSSTEDMILTCVDQVVTASTSSLFKTITSFHCHGRANLTTHAMQELLRREYERGLHEGVNIRNSLIIGKTEKT